MHSDYPPNNARATRFSVHDQGPQPVQALVITKTFRISDLLTMVDTGELDIWNTSDLPRGEQWDHEHASRLIESVLLRIPLPAVYFREHENSAFQVVSGQQCLAAVYAYVRGVFPLCNPRCLSGQAGAPFIELTLPLRQQLLRTRMVAHIIDSSVPHHVACSLLGRLNSGWVSLE